MTKKNHKQLAAVLCTLLAFLLCATWLGEVELLAHHCPRSAFSAGKQAPCSACAQLKALQAGTRGLLCAAAAGFWAMCRSLACGCTASKRNHATPTLVSKKIKLTI